MKPVAAMILAAGLATMAQAAETGTLTLACTGTTVARQGTNAGVARKEVATSDPIPISMGLIVSFTDGTVQGFHFPGSRDIPVKIGRVTEVAVAFYGGERISSSTSGAEWIITGSIDRVTGDVEATRIWMDEEKTSLTVYSLKCRPTQRLF